MSIKRKKFVLILIGILAISFMMFVFTGCGINSDSKSSKDVSSFDSSNTSSFGDYDSSEKEDSGSDSSYGSDSSVSSSSKSESSISSSKSEDPKPTEKYDDLSYGLTANATYKQYATDYISLTDITVNNGIAYLADVTAKSVYAVNVSSNRIINTYYVGENVNCISFIENKLYVGVGERAGKILILNKDTFAVEKEIETDHTPVDVIYANGKIYCANRFSNNVTVYEKNTMKKTATISVAREPMALKLVGNKIFVVNQLPAVSALEENVSSEISVINTSSDVVTNNIRLVNGTTSLKDAVVSSNGKYLYVTCVVARYLYPTTQVQYGWINTNAVAIIDVQSLTHYATVLLDEETIGAPNPWGITVQNGKIVVALSGSQEIMVINENKMLNSLASLTDKERAEVVNQFAFLQDNRERFDLSGRGARAVFGLEGKVYVASFYDAVVEVLNVSNNSLTVLSAGSQKELDAVRYGDIMWHDGTLGYQSFQSCSTCHVDGRTDGLNWDEPFDDIGNPKQTQTMLYTHRMPPVTVVGASPSAEDNVVGSIEGTHHIKLKKEQYAYVDEYLKSLTPVTSPYLNRDGSLTESAKRGKILFSEYGCIQCHSGPNFTDLHSYLSPALEYDDSWEDREMFVPSLVESWRTAPYTFNGYAYSMVDAVKIYAKNISDKDAEDLANYVLSIGNENEYYGVEQVVWENNGENIINKISDNYKLMYLTVRKQKQTNKDVFLRFALLDKNDKQIGEGFKSKISGLTKVGDIITIKINNFVLPKQLEDCTKYVITIVDGNGNYLATPYEYCLKKGE